MMIYVYKPQMFIFFLNNAPAIFPGIVDIVIKKYIVFSLWELTN